MMSSTSTTFSTSLNRTNVELKLLTLMKGSIDVFGLNRTNVELKRVNHEHTDLQIGCLNRTNVELKQ